MKFGKDIYAPGTKHYRRYMVATELKNQRNIKGEKLCAWCGKVLENARFKYCSQDCQTEVYIRNGMNMKTMVRKRDNMVCAICGLDTSALVNLLERASMRITGENRPHPTFCARILENFGLSPSQAHNQLWEIDHIIPVKKGGGCCGVENLRTLCVWCHKKETKKLAQERGVKDV